LILECISHRSKTAKNENFVIGLLQYNESHAQPCTFIIQSSDINVKACGLIRYTVV